MSEKFLPEHPNLTDLQKYILKWKKERGFNVTNPVIEMMYLTEEIGELAAAIRRSDKMKKTHYDINKDRDDKVGDEMADILYFLLNIANIYNIDLEDAFMKKAAENETRVWKKVADKND